MREKEEEIWKDIPGYEGMYQASNMGNIRSLDRTIIRSDNVSVFKAGKLLKPTLSTKGYERVRLCSVGQSVHRLIGYTFIPNFHNKPQINHKDGNKRNNKVYNLEWCDNSENQIHALNTGLKIRPIGEINANSKLTQVEVNKIIELYNSGLKIKQICKITNNPLSRIRTLLYGFSWKDSTKNIVKRDDRSERSIDHTNKTILTRFERKLKNSNIIVTKIDKITGEETNYKSLNEASILTGVPRSSIHLAIYGKASHAGGFLWKKSTITKLEELL